MRFFSTFSMALVALCFFSFSCSKNDNADPIMDTEEKIMGSWASVRVLQNGVDITSNGTSGTFQFKNDKTFTGTATENFVTIPVNGTWEIRAQGDSLRLNSTISGTVDYFIHNLGETDMTLDVKYFGTMRRAEFEKQ